MEIYTNFNGNVLYLCLHGEIDEHSASLVRREADLLAERYAGCIRVIFDLKNVTFMDSTGIGFLIGRYKTFQRLGVPTYINNPTQETDKILSMSGVYTLMPRV
jgi:stage II sporulation protein AA (anti-sigma F factor antagonist)